MKDVVVVETRPPAVFKLAAFEEPNDAECEHALVRHAQMLGADRLFVDRTQGSCRGEAYGMQDRSVTTSDAPAENYSQTLHAWMRSRWKRPAGVTDDELAKLCVVTSFRTNMQLRIYQVAGTPQRPSGNAAFDDSVRALLESAIDEHVSLPEPRAVTVDRNVRNAQITIAFGANGPCR
jgi:hypothetical protein